MVCPETARPYPPNVAPDPPGPPGIAAKPVATTGCVGRQYAWCDCAPRAIVLPNQTRLNAAFPESNILAESPSRYASTLGGEIRPIQLLARSHARIAAGLFTLMVRSRSIIRPPPSAACHSRALHVKPSACAPCHT